MRAHEQKNIHILSENHPTTMRRTITWQDQSHVLHEDHYNPHKRIKFYFKYKSLLEFCEIFLSELVLTFHRCEISVQDIWRDQCYLTTNTRTLYDDGQINTVDRIWTSKAWLWFECSFGSIMTQKETFSTRLRLTWRKTHLSKLNSIFGESGLVNSNFRRRTVKY